MAESSLFAQRLQAITERRRLQERILSTRRELEEERLRAQRLKRKSLRDRWLMEGTSIPTDDNDHTPSSWEAQTRIQELEQDLLSLESQMQQLDNPERRQGQRQLEESVKAVKEVKPSLDGIGKVDGTSPASPEGRSSTKSRPELAPVPPKRPTRAAAKEKLQNGDMSGVGPFGSQCSPDKVDIKMSPMVTEAGDLPSHQGNSEAAPAPKPAWQNLNPSEVPAGRQRKLAVEEMVIRDHLGQEVGSMDAVGQKQRSIGKEEELEDHADLGDMPEEQGRPTPCILDHEKALEASETQVDSELGSRDGPEGQSPTSQDPQSPSKPLQAENSCLNSLKKQEEVGLGSLAKGAALMEVEQKELPEQSAKETEPAKDLVVSDAPAAEPVRWEQEKQARKQGLQEPQGLETTVVEPGGERGESWVDQPTPLLLASVSPVQETKVPSSLEEAKIPLLDPVLSSSLPDQIPLTLQDHIPPLQDAKGSLLDQIPSSFQETEGSLLDPVLSLSTQSPSTLLDQTPPLQESKESPLCQIPCSFQESLLDSNPPSHQHHISSSPEQKPPSLQGDITFPQETKHSLLDQVPSSLNEANGQLLDQIPTSLQDQSPSLPNQISLPLPDQCAAPLEVDSALPGQILSSLPETERSLQISTALQGQELSVQDAKQLLPDLTPTSINQQSSLPDKVTSLQEAKRSSLDEIPLTLQDQMPTPSVQNFSQPEANISLPGQIPSSVDETKYIFPGETPVSVLDQIPPALQDQKPAFLEDKTPSSLQEVEGSLPDRIQTTLPSLTSPSLPEATRSSPDQAQPTLREEMPIPLPGQTPCLQEAEKSLPEEQIPSSLPEEMPTLSDQALTPNKLQSSTLQDTATFPDVLPLSTQEPVQSTLDKTAPEKNQDLKEGGDANLVTAATAEVTEVLGNLHAEQQPLLEECKASVAPPDTSIGDLQQSKTEILKPLVATSQEAPTYTTTSANTASSSQPQPAVPCQGEDQEQGQSRRKHKSCQCCSVM